MHLPATTVTPTPSLVLEAALLCAGGPLPLTELTALFGKTLPEEDVHALVLEMGARWGQENKGFELTGDANAWRVRSRPELAEQLAQLGQGGRQRHKYSSAVLETLAVVAYLQPCTRTTIEEKRKRAVTPGVLEQLTERGWVEVIGHQESPGRPALYATTFKFLDDLGLTSIADLPSLDASLDSRTAVDPAAAAFLDPDDPWEGEDSRIYPDAMPLNSDTPPQLPDLPLEALPEPVIPAEPVELQPPLQADVTSRDWPEQLP